MKKKYRKILFRKSKVFVTANLVKHKKGNLTVTTFGTLNG